MKWTDTFKGNSAPKASEATTQPVEDEPRFTFSEDGKSVRAEGLAALEQCSEGYDVGDGIACFTGRGNDKTMMLANTKTGKVRCILSSNGRVLVSDGEIDHQKVNDMLEYPEDVKCKCSEYHFGFYDWFEEGYAELSWTDSDAGVYNVGDGLVIRDHNWRTGDYGKMTYREAFIRKSDVAYYKAAAAYNKTDAKEALKMFCSKTTEGTGSILLRNVQGHPTTLIAPRW